MPRFVILRHEPGPQSTMGLHWDLMFEVGGVLRTWALADEPGYHAAIPARQLPDHRLDYLEIEGEISGGRGTVSRWDAGEYQASLSRDANFQREFSARLDSPRFRGKVTLRPATEQSAAWECRFFPAD